MSKNNFSKTVTLDNGEKVQVTNHQIAGDRYWSSEKDGRAYDSHQEMMETLNSEADKSSDNE